MTSPDQIRQLARQAQTATRILERAVSKGDMQKIREALDAGASQVFSRLNLPCISD